MTELIVWVSAGSAYAAVLITLTVMAAKGSMDHLAGDDQ